MVLVQENDGGDARDPRGRSWSLLLLAVLTLVAGCIPSSAEYPYRGSDAGSADACVSPTEEEICEEASAECGALALTDRCGDQRTVNCGDCTDGAVCTAENTCCQQNNDAALCSQYNAECGTLEATDNCGRLRTVMMCGDGCPDGVTCNGTTCGDCDRESDREFCDRYGKSCGTFSGVDGCGEQRDGVTCGTCEHGANCTDGVCVCPGGGTENICDDGEDNDCDGLEDCEDPDCDNDPCGEGPLGIIRCRNSQCPL